MKVIFAFSSFLHFFSHPVFLLMKYTFYFYFQGYVEKMFKMVMAISHKEGAKINANTFELCIEVTSAFYWIEMNVLPSFLFLLFSYLHHLAFFWRCYFSPPLSLPLSPFFCLTPSSSPSLSLSLSLFFSLSLSVTHSFSPFLSLSLLLSSFFTLSTPCFFDATPYLFSFFLLLFFLRFLCRLY